MAFPPEFYLIGAQKAGTTQFSHLLAAHPDICVSTPKEPNFFTDNWSRGLDWYRRCFLVNRLVFVDASTSYSAARPKDLSETDTLSSEVPERIYSINESARFIYIVRDPALRAYSAYLHNIRYHGERRSFRRAVEEDWQYLAVGNYYAQIRQYLRYFPINSILLLDFARLVSRPQDVLAQCFRFMELSPISLPSQLLSRQRNMAYSLTRVGAGIRQIIGYKNFAALSNYVQMRSPTCVTDTVRQFIIRRAAPMPEADYHWMVDRFYESNRRLEELFGRKFPDWGCGIRDHRTTLESQIADTDASSYRVL